MRENPRKDEPIDEPTPAGDLPPDDIPPIDFRVDPQLLDELKLPGDDSPPPPLDLPDQPPGPAVVAPGEMPAAEAPKSAPNSQAPLAPAPDPTKPSEPAPPSARIPPAPPAAKAAAKPPAIPGWPVIEQVRARQAPPARPAIPSPSAHDFDQDPASMWRGGDVQDDDAIIFPAPSPQALAASAARAASEDRSLRRSLFVRRTMIPILLTMGLMLPTLGILWFRSDADSLIRGIGQWPAVSCIVLGGVLLLLAVVNMAQVKHLADESRRDRMR